RRLVAEHLDVAVHRLLELAAKVGDALAAAAHAVTQLGDQAFDPGRSVGRKGGSCGDLVRVLSRGDACATTKDVDVEQRVGAEAVGAMHGDACAFAGGVQAFDHVVVVAQHLAADGRGDAAHRVVSGGVDGDGLGVRLDAKVG